MATKQRLNVLVVDRDEGSNIAIKDFLTEELFDSVMRKELVMPKVLVSFLAAWLDFSKDR